MRARSERRTLRATATVILTVFSLAMAGPVAGQGSVETIASQLICLCGCGKLLNVCEMDTARQMRSVISEKLEAGWNTKRIISYMTETYGERVLAAPTKRGFNLTAWVTPFAFILAGGAVIVLVVGTWTQARAARVSAGIGGATLEGLESRYGAIVDREIDEFGS
jgi:cytochrome c-type biogenesis protein CcmH